MPMLLRKNRCRIGKIAEVRRNQKLWMLKEIDHPRLHRSTRESCPKNARIQGMGRNEDPVL